MKCLEAYRILQLDGWYPVSQKGSHVKLRHSIKPGIIVFPNHSSQELEKALFKQARIQ